MKNNLLYLKNIQECIENIESYTVEGEKHFFENKIIQDAVIRNLEIMGEATKRLSSELRSKYNEVPWRQIAGLRDVLIHDYLKVDLQEVWIIVKDELPVLKTKIKQIMLDNFMTP